VKGLLSDKDETEKQLCLVNFVIVTYYLFFKLESQVPAFYQVK
jgi:hypothetical protein